MGAGEGGSTMIQALRKAPNAGTLEADINESSYEVDSSSRIHHYRVARLARKGERWRPARLDDVITERGEFVGNGIVGGLPVCDVSMMLNIVAIVDVCPYVLL